VARSTRRIALVGSRTLLGEGRFIRCERVRPNEIPSKPDYGSGGRKMAEGCVAVSG